MGKGQKAIRLLKPLFKAKELTMELDMHLGIPEGPRQGLGGTSEVKP